MSKDKFSRSVRLPESEVSYVLQTMDAGVGAHSPGSTRRTHPRMEYRVSDIAVAITHPGGSIGRYLVQARNLSAGGMSFLHGGYLHVGAECCAVLITIDGDMKGLRATVRACRHVTKNIHEIGVQFHEKIDPGRFLQPNARTLSGKHSPADSASAPTLSGRVLLLTCDGKTRSALTAWRRKRPCASDGGIPARTGWTAGSCISSRSTRPTPRTTTMRCRSRSGTTGRPRWGSTSPT